MLLEITKTIVFPLSEASSEQSTFRIRNNIKNTKFVPNTFAKTHVPPPAAKQHKQLMHKGMTSNITHLNVFIPKKFSISKYQSGVCSAVYGK